MTFEPNEDEIDCGILGDLIMDVNEILVDDRFEDLMRLCEFPVDKKWELIYKASQDGFESCDFHTECDYKSNTLVIIKTKNGNVFGGYTEQSWSNSDPQIDNIDKPDPKAFIFSLINKEDRPLKIKCSPNNGIRCSNSSGPIFGGKKGYSDLMIDDNSNRNNKSFSYFGHYYIHPDYEYKSDKANSFLAGTHNFKVLEIEVYTTN